MFDHFSTMLANVIFIINRLLLALHIEHILFAAMQLNQVDRSTIQRTPNNNSNSNDVAACARRKVTFDFVFFLRFFFSLVVENLHLFYIWSHSPKNRFAQKCMWAGFGNKAKYGQVIHRKISYCSTVKLYCIVMFGQFWHPAHQSKCPCPITKHVPTMNFPKGLKMLDQSVL